jgi:hypothetical protein
MTLYWNSKLSLPCSQIAPLVLILGQMNPSRLSNFTETLCYVLLRDSVCSWYVLSVKISSLYVTVMDRLTHKKYFK